MGRPASTPRQHWFSALLQTVSGTGATRSEFTATTHGEVLVPALFPDLPGTTRPSDRRGRTALVPARHLYVA